MFSVTDENLFPGSYLLTIEATDVLGQSATLDVPFTLIGRVGMDVLPLFWCYVEMVGEGGWGGGHSAILTPPPPPFCTIQFLSLLILVAKNAA